MAVGLRGDGGMGLGQDRVSCRYPIRRVVQADALCWKGSCLVGHRHRSMVLGMFPMALGMVRHGVQPELQSCSLMGPDREEHCQACSITAG